MPGQFAKAYKSSIAEGRQLIPKIYFQYFGNSQNIGSNYRCFATLQTFLHFFESLTAIAFEKHVLNDYPFYGIPVGYNRTKKQYNGTSNKGQLSETGNT